MNTCSQLSAWVIHAINGANTTTAMYCAELNSAEAVPRSRVGNQQLTMRELAGKAGDSTRPSMNRMENSATAADTPARPIQPTVPCSRVNSDQRIKLMP
ncbi:hypothetical protein D3C79_557450 [compost metagenome]